jgi:hypothetical protein
LERKKERDEKIARGEAVGPEERDPTAEEEIGLLGLLKFLVYLLIFAGLAGKFVTGSYTWEYESKWTQLKTYWPVRKDLYLDFDRIIDLMIVTDNSSSVFRALTVGIRRNQCRKTHIFGSMLVPYSYISQSVDINTSDRRRRV